MRTLALLLLLATLAGGRAFAGVEQISERDFRALAAELSPRVNLFRDAWERDPDAQFYGGTTRDFLYWLKGKFRDAHTPADAERVAAILRARPAIDVREFIIGDSDVDLFTPKDTRLNPNEFGVRKIDVQQLDVLDPKSELGRNEVNQGFLPAEKIRLRRAGLETTPALGDGVHEIYSGKITVHFAPAEAFAKSKYAAEGINHPVLLALRYLRLQAINYFQEHGGGVADARLLLASLDPKSAATVRKVIDGTLDGKELAQLLTQPLFKKWINAGIRKAFRSYTNPDAARILMKEFRVTELPTLYPAIEPVNQYVFAKHRDEAKVAKSLAALKTDPQRLYRAASAEFPDGFLYHGTKTEEAFRGILFQGVLASETGSGGAGLYGVAEGDRAFAEKWGGDPLRLLRFPVAPDAKIVDVTQGEGARVWETFAQKHGGDYEAFAEATGADILRYPYSTKAYVVKNSGSLGRAQGVHRELLPFPELIEKAATIKTYPELANLLAVNSLTSRERALVVEKVDLPPAEVEKAFRDPRYQADILRDYFPRPPFSSRDDLMRELLGEITMPFKNPKVMESPTKPLAALFATPAWREKEELILLAATKLKDPEFLTNHLSQPGVPYLPKVWESVTKQVPPLPKAAMLKVFRNPAYEREVATIASLIGNLQRSEEFREASIALREPFWTKYPKLLEDFVTRDLAMNLKGEVGVILGSADWNRDQPELMRAQLKRCLNAPDTESLAPTFASLLENPIHPFDEESRDLFLVHYRAWSTRLAAFVKDKSPHARFILDGLMKLPKFDQQTIDFLSRGELPEAARERVRLEAETLLLSISRQRGAPILNLLGGMEAILRVGGPSEEFSTAMMGIAQEYWRNWPSFHSRELKELGNLSGVAARNRYMQDLRKFYGREIERADTVPGRWNQFRDLLQPPKLPESFEPLLEDFLRHPNLPDDLKLAVASKTMGLLDLLSRYHLTDSRSELGYRLLAAQPKLLENPEVWELIERWAETTKEFESGVLPAHLLAVHGRASPSHKVYLEGHRAQLAQFGLPIEAIPCPTHFAAVGGER